MFMVFTADRMIIKSFLHHIVKRYFRKENYLSRSSQRTPPSALATASTAFSDKNKKSRKSWFAELAAF
jgi:hypothetical protein